VIQADIFKLPFPDESFDFIFSIGVLHHTPDCRAAFAALPRLLRPDGRISIWVYSGYDDALRLNEMYRQFAQKLPRRALYALSHLSIPYYWLHKIPLVGSSLHHFFPRISLHANRTWRVLDTYDWFSPKYQSHHTYPELYEWFHAAGLVDVAPLPMPVSMTGRRP
jgi:ubiquinone/menaquinone biosynthesis C-methylase UbiE